MGPYYRKSPIFLRTIGVNIQSNDVQWINSFIRDAAAVLFSFLSRLYLPAADTDSLKRKKHLLRRCFDQSAQVSTEVEPTSEFGTIISKI